MVFIFQILYGGKSGEGDPLCECVVNYPKVIFPFFHCTVFLITVNKLVLSQKLGFDFKIIIILNELVLILTPNSNNCS